MRSIFLVDDDADDRDTLKDALEEVGCTHPVMEARDGYQALRKLEELKAKGSLPCLIVLDINMPVMDGRDTLLSLQADGVLRGIPVVVYSTSSSDVDRSWFAGKNVAFYTKPDHYSGLIQIAHKLLEYRA